MQNQNRTLIKQLFLVGLLWIFTLFLRGPYFGKLSDGHHQWLTASSLIYLENWIKEGAIETHFRLNDAPLQQELKIPEERYPYRSYPSGAILLPYFGVKFTNIVLSVFDKSLQPPFLIPVMVVNLVGHLVIAMCLLFLSRAWTCPPGRARFFLPLAAPAFYLLTEKPLYWHQNVYFADQAVILFYVITGALFASILCPTVVSKSGGILSTKRKHLFVLLFSFVTLFLGLITDWFMCFAWSSLFCFFLTGLRNSQTLESKQQTRILFFLLLIPAFLSAAFYTFNLLGHSISHLPSTNLEHGIFGIGFTDSLKWLMERFIYRTVGEAPTTPSAAGLFSHSQFPFLAIQINPWLHFFKIVFTKWLGYYDLIILLFCMGCIFIKRSTLSPFLRFCFVYFMLAPLAQLFIFRNHSLIHDFSVLKLVPGIALLFPYFTFQLCEKTTFSQTRKTLLFFLLYLGFLVPQIGKFDKYFPRPKVNGEEIAHFIRKVDNTTSGIFISDSFEINHHPPQLLALGGKRVWKLTTLKDFSSWKDGRNVGGAAFYFISKKVENITHDEIHWNIYRLDSATLIQLAQKVGLRENENSNHILLSEYFLKHGRFVTQVSTFQ